MDERSEKTIGLVLILFGVSMWEILPPRGLSFNTVLLIHMSLVLPGVYLFEKPMIKYLCYRIKGGK
ncbi:MAG: hypothetical protein D6733_03560 [Methanobacteriota archaeon]|nr:MAG: hypothetical protein D6733_03560 [Euryarchaeota archaeon]